MTRRGFFKGLFAAVGAAVVARFAMKKAKPVEPPKVACTHFCVLTEKGIYSWDGIHDPVKIDEKAVFMYEKSGPEYTLAS